jgi:hypothetical protein
MKIASMMLLASLTTACAVDGDPPADPAAPDGTVDALADTEELPTLALAAPTGQATAVPITYHGGAVMLGTTKVYLVWYGAWGTNTALTIVPNFVKALGGTPYFNINTSYSSKVGTKVTAVSNALTLGGQTTDAYSRGKAIGDNDVAQIVATAIASKKLPGDDAGIYVVLTSADVNETSGFCTRYCGWHTYGQLNGAQRKISFIGNPDRCPTACEAQTAKSPNANPGADGMLSVLAHEIDETVSDPNLNAWYDAQGWENGDKCAWTFGTTYAVGNGSRANVKLGGKDYLIQQNWNATGAGSCALAK